MLKRFTNKFFKNGTRDRWDAILPFLFLGTFFFYLTWQLYNFSSLSTWQNNNANLIWDLKTIDTHVLEMHNNFRGYFFTRRPELLKNYHKSRYKLVSMISKIQYQSIDPDIREGLGKVEVNIGRWNEMTTDALQTNPIIIKGRGTEIIKRIRDQFANLINYELSKREAKQKEFETKGMRIFYLSTFLMLILSVFFVRHLLRRRKLAMELQKREAAYKELVEVSKLAEQRFRGLLESAHDQILISDEHGKILYVNHQLAQSFGYYKEELIGKEIEILVPFRYRDLHVVQRDTYLAQPVARPMGNGMDLFARKKDGKEIPVEITLSPFYVEGVLQVAAIIRDISDRKHQQKRQYWLAEFGQIINASLEPNALMVSLGDFCLGKFADWCTAIPNNGEIRIIKRRDPGEEPIIWTKNQEKLSRGIFKLVEHQIPYLKANISQADLKSLPFSFEELSFIFKLGIRSIIISPLVGRDKLLGAFIFVNSTKNYTMDDVNFVQDIVGRAALSLDNARLYQISQQSIHMREELLRIVSHDLKNPLNSIKLNIQVLERYLEVNEKDGVVLKRIQNMEKSTDHAVQLIKDLLDNAKIETGGLILKKSPLDVRELLKETQDVFESLAEEKGICFSVKNQLSKEPYVLADHERIFQVISNLLGNALKHTPSNGHLQVSVRDVGGGVEITISDDGPGISQERQAHLFEKYWQDEKTGLHNLGLGLSIAKGVIEAHGGNIWVQSEEGHGTTFSFYLPSEIEMGSSILPLQ